MENPLIRKILFSELAIATATAFFGVSAKGNSGGIQLNSGRS